MSWTVVKSEKDLPKESGIYAVLLETALKDHYTLTFMRFVLEGTELNSSHLEYEKNIFVEYNEEEMGWVVHDEVYSWNEIPVPEGVKINLV